MLKKENFESVQPPNVLNDLAMGTEYLATHSHEEKKNNIQELTDKKGVNRLLQFEQQHVSIFKLYYALSEKKDFLFMLIGTIGSLGAGVSMPLFAILFGRTLSGYSFSSSSDLAKTGFKDTVNVIVRNFLIVGVSAWFSYFLMISMWSLVGMRLVHKMKDLYFRAILMQEQAWFDENNPYEFSTKVQAQIKQVEGGIGEKLGTLLFMFSQLLSGIIIAMTTSWKLTMVILSLSPLLILSVIIMFRTLKNGMNESRKAYEIAGGIAEEVLYNIKTVASFANFNFEINRFNHHIDDCQKIGIKNSFKYGLGMSAVHFFIFSSYVLAIIYGVSIIVNHEWNTNAGRAFQGGDVLTVVLATVTAVTSIGILSPNLKAVAEACIGASDFFYLQKRVPFKHLSEHNFKPEKDSLSGKIEFKKVSFSYPSKPELKILKAIDLTFEPGTKVAIVGESGSGKSTVVNLLERLYDSYQGTICIDGIDIREFDVDYLRSLIGYVQQEPVLFNKTIKENIIFGRDLSQCENSEKMIQDACDDAYINEIKSSDGKQDFLVGIKGGKLSGGQKQRVAIARAILTKPKILLLDEATSALDNRSEKEVQRALDKISQKKVTTIIIAHRLSTVKNADKIYAIKNGVVLEEGNHNELIEKNGYYASLVKSQQVDEEEDKGDKIQENGIEEKIAQEKIAGEDVELKTEAVSKKDANNKEEKEGSNEKLPPVAIERSKIFNFLSDNKGNLLLASLGSSVNGCIFPIYGFLLASSINALSGTDTEKVKSEGFFMGMMFLVLAFCSGCGTFFQNYKFTQIGEILTSKLRKEVFSKYLKLHLGYFDNNENSPGALATKLSIDTTLLNGIVLTVVGVSIQSFVCFGLGLVLGFVHDWRLSMICIAFMPFMILSAYMQQKLRKGISSGDDKLDIEAGNILSECVTISKTIFSYNYKDKAVQEYLEILAKTQSSVVKQSLLQGALFGIGQFSMFASYATVFFSGGSFILNGTLDFNNMTRAIMSILFSSFGLGIAQQYVGDYVKAQNAFASIFATLDIPSEIDTSESMNENKKSANNIEGKIEFKDVEFSYPTRPNELVLKKINFTINPGQSVAFVGFSGSGKSTIIQLIERFYDVQKGNIYIDDVDIRDYNLLELRKKIGLVLQEPVLFKGNVRDNIIYGDLTANDQKVLESAEKANILKFFGKNDVGTKDSPFSGGEKQRIAIARAFIKNPKILLLDEATSALNKDLEEEIQKELNVLQKERTSITIAHRLNTVENCDVIYVLENGIIVENGSHKELFEKKGKYFSLYNASMSA
jgi:ATP-binding cassette subfamily B (MDR/TAP) protein 1